MVMTVDARKSRSLLPREHGAYVQLFVPLATVIVRFGASVDAVLLAIGACLAFLANEPLLVMLGHRGKRAKEIDAARARRRLFLLGSLAVASGAAGLLVTSDAARTMAAIVCAPAIVLLVLGWRRRQHSLGGELVAAAVLTGASAPVAAALGVPLREVIVVWAAWSIGYGATVLAIHRVIDRHKRAASRVDHIVSGGLLLLLVVLVLVAMASPHPLIAIPLVLASAVMAIVAPPATKLRTIGFVLVGASVVSSLTAALLVS